MRKNLINIIQKFLSKPFRCAELLMLLDKQKDFLLQKSILDKTENCEYNALWDTIYDLEKFFEFTNEPNLVIGVKMNVFEIFDYNYKWREKAKKEKQLII